jgi:hypothetical protein
MTVEECLRAAWEALLRGDTAERDRLVRLAQNVMSAGERIKQSGDATDIMMGTPIKLDKPE